MIIDIIFFLLLIMAVIKGYRNGFIVAVFSFLAIIIGLAAAIKFSTLAADWLKESTRIAAAWIPFLSFALIMLVVMLLVRLGAKLIQSALDLVFLGWLNKLAGILLYAVLYITVFSVVLFYCGKIQLLKPETYDTSVSYQLIKPWGPKAIEWIGNLIPFFKGMFEELSRFFEKMHPTIR